MCRAEKRRRLCWERRGWDIYGTLDNGKETSAMEFACKSGLAATRSDGVKICDTLKTEPQCSVDTDTTALDWTLTSNAETGDCSCVTDMDGKDICYVERYSTHVQKIFDNYLEEYNDLDLEKINSEEKYVTGSNEVLDGKIPWKMRKASIILENYVGLQKAGIIDEEGEPKDDKDCEFEFIIKHLSFRRMKVNVLIMILLSLICL